jgi:multidrug resistance protein MdtO
MATHASNRRFASLTRLVALLAPYPGRLEFAVRLALLCALTTLVVEIYQTPEPALTTYVAFFVIKPDRATSVVVSIVMLLLMTLIVGTVLLTTMAVIDQPLWRVTAMAVMSFCLLFAASASKLKPVASIVALIAAYALDILGTAHIGELATRGLLYAWLFVGIPAGVSIAVNLLFGPAPRRLAERALAHRLRLSAAMLRAPDAETKDAFSECLHEGAGEIPIWLKLAGAEKSSPAQDIAALRQATQSTAIILSLVDVLARNTDELLPYPYRERIARLLDEMADILQRGGYPTDITFNTAAEDAELSPLSAAVFAELRHVMTGFIEIPPPEAPSQPVPKTASGFFLPDAFSNPAHVQYALKTTAAAMFCYVVYSLLDWPGIHTCLITCYIVSLGTIAETAEKLTLRVLGCLVGAATGIAAIIFLMPSVTSIGALMAIVFLAALVSGWIAAGSPRISYVGFQLAFAFFLSVVQGSAPAFDMTIARDRVIGIIFGNLVVALVFTQVWPASVAGRIDPAIAALLRRLAAMAAAGSRSKRWAFAADTQTALGAIEQDLDLTRYEPSSLRPTSSWMNRRREVTHAIAALQGPLLLDVNQDPDVPDDIARRLARLAERFGAQSRLEVRAIGDDSVTLWPSPPEEQAVATSMTRAFLEAPLATLEQAVARPSVDKQEGRASYAPV